MKTLQYDYMIHLALDGHPLCVLIYERSKDLPRQYGIETRGYLLRQDFPAEHSADMVNYYYNRAVVTVHNVKEGCLCHCPYLGSGVPPHVGVYNSNTKVLGECNESQGFDSFRLQYCIMYEGTVYDDGLFVFMLGKAFDSVLDWLARDNGNWTLDVANEKVRAYWGCMPKLSNQKQVADLLA